MTGSHEVRGSIPLSSTRWCPLETAGAFRFEGRRPARAKVAASASTISLKIDHLNRMTARSPFVGVRGGSVSGATLRRRRAGRPSSSSAAGRRLFRDTKTPRLGGEAGTREALLIGAALTTNIGSISTLEESTNEMTCSGLLKCRREAEITCPSKGHDRISGTAKVIEIEHA